MRRLRLWHERVQSRLFNRATDWLARHTPMLAPLAPQRDELGRMRRGGYLRAVESRVERIVAGTVLVREHPWWAPAFLGRPVALGHGAAWLDPSRAAAVAAGAGRIRLVQGDVATILAGLEAGSLDAATVSNVPDWLDVPASRRLGDALVRAPPSRWTRPGPTSCRTGDCRTTRTWPGTRAATPSPPPNGPRSTGGWTCSAASEPSDDPPVHEIQGDPADGVGGQGDPLVMAEPVRREAPYQSRNDDPRPDARQSVQDDSRGQDEQ